MSTSTAMKLLDARKIWDAGPHNAFTDLVRWRGRFYCTFREGGGHVPADHAADGKIRILESSDGGNWTSAALIVRDGVDLRDPKLSITPDNRLMLLMGGSVYEQKKLLSRRPYVAFSTDGHRFGDLEPVVMDPKIGTDPGWLWRVTWHEGKAYGVVYHSRVDLVSSADGVHYDLVKAFDLTGQPNESSVAFLPDGRMFVIVRREAESKMGMVGLSSPPFKDWAWKEMNMRVGGPALCVLPGGGIVVATREYDPKVVTVVGTLAQDGKFTRMLEVPSGGDTSYPGLVLDGNRLWMSYYSSHEGKTSIYLARIELTAPVLAH